jgi:hypothetical protein
MGGDDGQPRHFFMQLAEPADDLVRKCPVIVAVTQDKRFADALLEPALVVHRVANVKQASRR